MIVFVWLESKQRICLCLVSIEVESFCLAKEFLYNKTDMFIMNIFIIQVRFFTKQYIYMYSN